MMCNQPWNIIYYQSDTGRTRR